MLEGLVAEIELRQAAARRGRGVVRCSGAASGAARARAGPVLDRTRDWAAEELAGRRLPASLEQLEEEGQDNAYDKAGFL